MRGIPTPLASPRPLGQSTRPATSAPSQLNGPNVAVGLQFGHFRAARCGRCSGSLRAASARSATGALAISDPIKLRPADNPNEQRRLWRLSVVWHRDSKVAWITRSGRSSARSCGRRPLRREDHRPQLGVAGFTRRGRAFVGCRGVCLLSSPWGSARSPSRVR